VKVKTSIDFNFWLALLAATGVPAFAWWMVRSALATVKESLAKTITVELCKANQAICQKSMFDTFSTKFASKDIEECVEDLREKREVTHARIYDEIKTNRENVITQLHTLRTDIFQMLEKAHESYKLEIENAVLRDRDKRSQKGKTHPEGLGGE